MSIDFSTVTAVTIPEGDVMQIAIGGSTVWKRQPPAGYWEVTRSDGTAPTAGTLWVVRLSDGATGYYTFATEIFTAVSFAVGDVVGHDDIMFSVDVDIRAGHMSQYVSLNGGTYKCVCWGDGTVSTVASGALAVNHTYATAGTYTVKTYAVEPMSIAYYVSSYADNRVSVINNAIPWDSIRTLTLCFAYSSELEYIPERLFDNCRNVTTFRSCFAVCTKLTAIPIGLFDYSDNCTTEDSFYMTFYYCSSIRYIPEGLFDHCGEGVGFRSCFAYCTGLLAIPAGLFDKCTAIVTFFQTFYWCTAITSALPELWVSHSSVPHTQCFTGCTQATNYATAQQAGWA